MSTLTQSLIFRKDKQKLTRKSCLIVLPVLQTFHGLQDWMIPGASYAMHAILAIVVSFLIHQFVNSTTT